MNNLSQFTNLYLVSKTLRFELKPIGKTLENIEKDGIISEDEKRAENYKKVKIIIDKYHKWFIEKSLSCVKLPEEKLNIYYNLYKATPDVKKEEKWNKEFEDIKKELRKEITNSFSSDEVKDLYKDLGKKELIRDILPEWKELDEEEKQLFGDFYQFTTYFVGFNENRKNMYSSEEKSTAISYRIINDNLPKFIDNIETFKIIKKTEFYSLFNNIYSELEPWLNISSIDEIFELTYLNEVLSQSQIEEYNFIIGGRSGEDRNDKIRGLNQYINEYNQKHEKKDRLPKFKMLYKQILSDREKISFLPESFENVNDLFVSVETYYKSNLLCVKNENNEEINIFDELSKLMSEISSYDLSKIYIKNDKNITDISQKLFGNYGVITSSINYYYESFINPNYKDDYARAKTESKRDRIEKDKEKYTKQKYLSLLEIQEAIKKYLEYTNEYSDSVVSLYNKVRSFVTKKPYSTEKIKLNFNSPTLLNGWDKNKEQDNLGIILIKNEKYYLGIISHKNRFIIDDFCTDASMENGYKKVVYRQIADASKDLPNLIEVNEKTIRKTGRKNDKGVNVILEEFKETYLPKKINQIRKSESYKISSKNFSKEDLTAYIDYYMQRIIAYKSDFTFIFKKPEEYNSYTEFIKDIDRQKYYLSYEYISYEDIKSLVDTGKLYLFQIYNKDFSASSKGKKIFIQCIGKHYLMKKILKILYISLMDKQKFFIERHPYHKSLLYVIRKGMKWNLKIH